MERITSNLEAIGDKIRSRFSTKHGAREKALPLCREVIRCCANAILAVHRGEYDRARELKAKARNLLQEASEALVEYQDIFHSGFIHNSQKEYAEACITFALVSGEALPDPDELAVEYPAYLNGMGEAVGELRRHLLDTIRKGEIARCEQILKNMDDIYSLLVTMDFPDALTAGLRRTTDVTRSIMEKTRGDLTLSMRQKDLEERLAAFEEKLSR